MGLKGMREREKESCLREVGQREKEEKGGREQRIEKGIGRELRQKKHHSHNRDDSSCGDARSLHRIF